MRETTAFSSVLAPTLDRYISLKRALGLRFAIPTRTLQSIDQFLHERSALYPDLNAAAFRAWCQTQENVTPTVRRFRMQQVYSFCLYRRRTETHCFLPDPGSFPAPHQGLKAFIFSTEEVASLLRSASGLKRTWASPLRPEVIRLAIALLFTTGIRRGELRALTLGDYNAQDSTLFIRESKFHKSRLLPINCDIADEIERYLNIRKRRRLRDSSITPFIWNATKGGRAYSGTGLQHSVNLLLKQCGVVTSKGRLPRIQDFRHSFAVNALLRWYRMGADVDSKLPFLAAYMGHISVASTQYYLQFIEPLRTAASERFGSHYGELVTAVTYAKGRRR